MMFASLIPSLLFGLAALAIIVYFLRALVAPFTGNISGIKGWRERLKFKKKRRLLSECDAIIANGYSPKAEAYLKESLFLDSIVKDQNLIDPIHNHNLAVIGRILNVFESHSLSPTKLPEIEELFLMRSQLNLSYFETVESRHEFKNKKRERGKKLPDWALGEFDKKLALLHDRLQTNRASLIKAIGSLFDALSKGPSEEEVQYH